MIRTKLAAAFRRRPIAILLAAIAAAALVATLFVRTSSGKAEADDPAVNYLPSSAHVFVIQLENKSYDGTFGPNSPAPYLSQTLRQQGVLLNNYYGIGHNSLDNYLAQISGQGPNSATQGDCPVYTPFVQTGTAMLGQAIGAGCVYPSNVTTLADQLTGAGFTWKGYMEDMGTPCNHPAIGAADPTMTAHVGYQYATRHNPFVYFQSITGSPSCAANDVDLSALKGNLASAATTANFNFIVPNLCNDGHDAPCVDGQPGGLKSADAWLKQWVPVIMNSPAFQQDGILMITFDESDGPQADSSACCGEGPGPNAAQPGLTGPGGGRTGALMVSPFVAPNTWSTTSYNHYSFLASMEELFHLPYLGYAGTPGLSRFGLDVYNKGV
ncbi:alkaline phosphatase family protein [Sinomonas sp. ASV322]|uniref:alkaline phosphatase family protein n=1 Tax=Sinomonas sp. ASV322 TaxID=3041920 RepID=UPI0027DB63AE|nr:alkaline phosphatase family protein [Sinomonas sp. ASV322]MDQ4503157.1 alkaline phosphatase family protein [Sinomonas sp. ASV322]